MYETGTAARFRAQHVMPGMDGPEGEPHSHDYRIEVVASRAELDERGMVVDLDVLDAALRDIVARLEGVDLHERIRPEGAEAVTVEVLARWAHDELARMLGDRNGESLTVRVWESDDAFGGYAAPL